MIHAMRSYEFMTVAVDRMNSVAVDKWEYFWLLKNLWSNPNFLDGVAIVPMLGEWTFWRMPRRAFPLCDSPVMIGPESLMALLSPRLLLEIDLNIRCDGHFWQVRDEVPRHKYAEFRRRSIANVFKEIIFHDASVLEDWKASDECTERIAKLRDPSLTKKCLNEAVERIMFGVKGFGRLTGEFQPWPGKGVNGT